MKELTEEQLLNLQYTDFEYYLNKILYNEGITDFLSYFNKISYKISQFPDLKIDIHFFILMGQVLKLQPEIDIESIKKMIFNSINFLNKKEVKIHAVIITPLDKSNKLTNNIKNWNQELFLLRIIQSGDKTGILRPFKLNLDSIIKSFKFKNFKYIKSDGNIFYDAVFQYNRQLGQTQEKK